MPLAVSSAVVREVSVTRTRIMPDSSCATTRTADFHCFCRTAGSSVNVFSQQTALPVLCEKRRRMDRVLHDM